MPFALIPDGYSLKKVTKLQQQAVKDKRRHDNVIAFINNPELMKQIIVVVAGYLAVKEAQDLYEYLAKEGVEIKQEIKDEYTRKRTFGAVPGAGVSIDDLVDEALKRIPFI
jgi:hypothetical protein